MNNLLLVLLGIGIGLIGPLALLMLMGKVTTRVSRDVCPWCNRFRLPLDPNYCPGPDRCEAAPRPTETTHGS